jgi:NADPH:quinone reductase-like Zn-dependent oxidoreductase
MFATDTKIPGTYYKDRRAGCFQQYVTVPCHTVCPIPDGIAFEEAACFGVAGLTAAMTLWHWLEVPGSPKVETSTISQSGCILIWGGSTITAQFAIQIAVLGGLKVIAVTSAKTKYIAEFLGATTVITRDGKTGEQIVGEIKASCPRGEETITRAIDLVGTETAQYCIQALSTSQPVLLAPLAMVSNDAIIPANVNVLTVEMKRFVLDPSSDVYARKFSQLVAEGRLVLPQIEVLHGGLQSVQKGLQRVKRGDMAGRKLVVRT